MNETKLKHDDKMKEMREQMGMQAMEIEKLKNEVQKERQGNQKRDQREEM